MEVTSLCIFNLHNHSDRLHVPTVKVFRAVLICFYGLISMFCLHSYIYIYLEQTMQYIIMQFAKAYKHREQSCQAHVDPIGFKISGIVFTHLQAKLLISDIFKSKFVLYILYRLPDDSIYGNV